MTLLAIDPGNTSGYVVLTGTRRPFLSAVGTWQKKKKTSKTEIVKQLKMKHRVTQAVIEDQFLGVNPDTLKKLARDSGQWQEACEANGIEVSFVFPSTWQSAILGAGRNMDSLQRVKVAKDIARSETKAKLNEHQACAYCIGRYILTEKCFSGGW